MKKLDFLPNLRNRYSIRRFTVGTASILIGSLLFLGHSGEAKAAENINDNNTVVEASNDSSTTQQAPEENNKTSLEKTVDATQQQTDNKAQTQNALEEVKKQATTEITSLKNLNKEEVDSYTLEVQQADSESTVHAIVEKAKAAAQAVEQKEESIQTQKTENSKESTETTVEKTKETPSTEAEPVKAEATVEKESEPVVENKEEAPESVVTPATEPAVEKAVETVTETSVLSPEQKVEKVKADLSNDYDSAKVDAVLAVIDTTDLTPEQLKSEVLRLLLEEASAQKDLFSPQATLPRTGEEASGYSTRAFDLEEAASQEIVVTKENFGEYFKTLNDATYDSQSGVVTLTTNEANKSGAMSLDFKLNLTKDFSFSGAVNLGDKYEAHPKDGVTGGEGLAITFNPGKTYTLGLTGQGFGIGGESSSFGFKLDTFVNKANDDKSKAFSDTIQFENKGAFGAFIYTTETGLVNTVIINPNASGNAALLKEQPNNQLVPFKFNYNGTTKVMTITYGTQTWTQNIQDYINYSRKDSFAFSIVASTTDHYNLQQIKLDEFRFTASAVLDEYFIDDDTEEAIDKPLRTAGDVNEKITLKDHAEYLAEKGYEFGTEKVRDEAHAIGYDEGAGTVTLENDAQQLVYTVVDIQNPTIAEVTDVTTNVSEAITPITLDITDNSGHFDTIAVTGLPTGLSFNETTKQITGTPTTPGDATVEVTATDMAGNTTTKTFKISVAGAQAPTITPINAQTGEAYTPITPIAVNVEGDLNPAPTVAVTGLPAGLSFDAATKQITGTPTAEGTFNVTVTATQEASEPATSTFNITVQPNAALKDLKAAVADAATVNKDSYTPNSVEAYEAKVTAGDTLAGQPENGSNAQFADASKAIKDAKNALVPRADKAALNQSITTAEALQPLEAGDPEDDALKTALETAKTVQGDLNIDQPAVNKAKTDLDNAIAAKNLQDELDKEDALDELRKTLEYVETIDPAQFTTSSKKAFTEALTNAKTILGSPGSKTIAEIKAATNALEDAQNVLVPQADKTALKTAINTANGYNNLNPNNPVDKALQDKLAAANAVNTNGDATADQVKTATDDLNTAITAKKAQDDQIAKDAAAKKAALDALNDELNKVKALDKATYTPNTVTPLTEKQTAAQAIADAPDTKTTEEINAATKALKDAQNALVPKANKDDLNNSVKTAEALPLNPADTEDKAVQDALDKAKTVQADDNATQDAVNTAQTDLDNTVAAKKAQDAKDAAAKQAALDALNDELNKVKALDQTTYTPNTVTSLTEKQTAAQAIADAPDTKTTEEINAATKALKDAKDALVPKADKTDLQKALDTAKAITGLEPTDKEDKAVQDAIDAAQTVNKDDNATPQQVADATKAINDAVATKAHQDALDQLNKALEDAAKVDKTDYTADSVKPFDTAVKAGKTAAGDNTSTVEALNNATKAVKDATAQLVPDKSKLDTAITEAKALEPLTDSNTDQLLKNVLNAAETVKNNPNATPEEIKTATWNLEDEINNKKAADAIEALKSAVNKAEQLNEAKYTPNTYEPLKTAITEGQKIINNPPSADTPATLAKAKQIEELVNALKERADKTELGNALDKAIAYGDLNPNDAEDKALQDAVTAGQKVNGDGNATTEEVANAVKTINDAIAAKERQDAVDELTKAINDAKTVNKDDYKPNTVTPFETAVTAGETAKDDATKTVEEIKAATKAITDAKNALDKKADKTELNTSVTTAEKLGAFDTKDAEDKAVQDALDKAKTVQADQNATQEAVNTAKTELDNAVNAKKDQDAKDAQAKQEALDALKAELDKVKAVDKTVYTPNTVTTLNEKETAGNDIVAAPEAKTTEEINQATQALKDAQNALVKKADKTELQKALDKANTFTDLAATDKEDKAVQDAVEAGNTVKADDNATVEQVEKATKAINDAVAAKERQDALDELNKAITDAKTVNKDDYKPNTVTPFETAVTAGETAKDDATKTVEELKAATKAITNAKNALDKKADKTELNTSVTTAEKLGALDTNDKEDKAIQDALDKAKTVQADDNASQEAVNTAKTELDQAVAAKKTQDELDALKKAALDELKAELSKVGKLVYKDYTPDSVKPLADKEVLGNAIVTIPELKTTEEIKAVTQELKDLQKALVQKADKTELVKALEKAKTLGALDATDKEDKAVQDAVTAGNTVNEDGNATTEQVANATKAINDAIAVKERQDALDELQKAIDDANTVKKDDYKPNTVTPFEAAVTAGETTKDDATKSVEEIKAATKAITDAKNALDKKADKTELDTSVTTAENIGALDTNDKEDKAVQDALDKAKTVQVDQNATQEAVNTAKTELDNALNAKKAQDTKEAVEKQNALDALKAELEKAKTVNKELYTTNSVKVLTDSETAGQNVVDNAANKTTQEIEEATKALKDAQANLVSKADKTELVKALEKAKTLGDLVATDKEDKAVQDAVTAGEAVNEDHNVTQEQVANATKAINDAIAAKERQDALDALTKAIKEANSVVKDEYKPNTVTPLEEAVKAGETARADATKTVEELKQAAQTITDAQNKLELKANKEELNKVVKTTETLELNPADKEDKAVQGALNTAKEVQADQNASQETVDKVKTDLENAVKAKTTQDKVDAFNKALDALKAELEKVKTIDKDFYTPNSVKPVTDAETAGQTIVNNSADKTVEEINKATQDLKEAQKHLVEKADKVELDKVIDTAENTELNVNDKEDKAVKDALDKAIKVQEDLNATQEEVDKAQSDLAKALENKAAQDKADQEKVQAFNKALEALKAQLASSRTVVKDNFTPNSVAPFEDAQAVAQGIVNNPESVTVEQVVKATEVLKSTQSSLVTKADKSELEKVIETAEGLDLNVTDKEDKAVKEALDTAVTVEADQNATQESVNKATSELEKAIENKVTQDKVDAFNKALEALKAQLASSRTVVKDNFTPNSVAPFEDAQAVAQGIVNNPESVTVEQVVKATEVLKSTQSSLVTKADKSELEKVIKTAEGLDLNVTDKEDKAVKDALDTAVTVEEDQNATQESVNKATSELEKAIENKVAQDKVDAFNKALEALKAQLASSRTVVKDNFTPNSVAPFEDAQAVAQGIVNNPESVTVEQVVKATEVLKSTQSSLVTKADKSELEKVIKTAEGLDLNVTDKEDKAVKDALDTAVTVEADQNATQESVDKAQSDLEKALETKAAQDKADAVAKAKADALAELEKALDKTETIDKSKYTPESVEKLDQAVVDGKVIVEKADNVSVQDIKEATKAVETALNGLEKVKAPAKETGKTTESTLNTAKSDTKSDVKAQDKQTSKGTKGTKAEKAGATKAKAENAGKNKAKALPETGQDVSSIDPQYASLMFAIGGLMMFFRKRKNEDKDNTEK
ncbi:putative Ig domain-containing protein [Staphylococcus simulans]|uniref:lectin-like domain-containing protein n=6 Tax=Staphylococcus TaxID=1279 RepID=UPI0025563457|nr:putative Ig domain-containing protein [Staphylococcus simulans]MDK8175555.1 putative Ig domain-containing protein [Staphylococcus simulans]